VVGIGARSRVAGRLAVAALSGAAVWASFPPLGLWWAAILGTAGLCAAVWGLAPGAGRRVAAAAGFGHAAVFWILLLSFVRVFGVDAWLILAAGESLFFIALALVLRVVLRLSWWPLAAAAAWVAEEALRDRIPFGGFPWGRLADAQAGGPIGRLAAVGGAPLVTFAVALSGALLAAVVVGLRHADPGSRRVRPAALLLLAATAVTAIGAAVPLPTAGTTDRGPASTRVALVQGDVPRLGLQAFAQAHAVTRNQMTETLALARRVKAGTAARPDVVVWPENSSDTDPAHDPVAQDMITRAVRAIGVPTLVGAVLDAPGGRLRNAGIVWSPTAGPGATYVKQHLLPFGEYLPFRAELSRWIGRFAMLPTDFTPGRRPGVLTLGPVRIADVICYEVADDGIVRTDVRDGGRLVVEQTNDASYEHAGDIGRGGESAQQLQIARLRAIEHGRAVVIVSTSGLSAVVAPDGQVLARTRIFAPGVLDVQVPLRDPLTLADRVGEWPEWLLVALALVAWAQGLRRGRGAVRVPVRSGPSVLVSPGPPPTPVVRA
jgi:apolipoprotein N-acyltransferase